MIEIRTIDLAQFGVILPSDRVGIVIAQPFLSLTPDEPYQCAPDDKARQLDALKQTLAVALKAPHGAPKTHFTIFPEYTIPGLDGIAVITDALTSVDWPIGTVVLGGVDALSRSDFASLAVSADTQFDGDSNNLDRIAGSEWVNCCITWVKSAEGTVTKWLQPKLSTAREEQDIRNQNMFVGRSVYTFKGRLENDAYFRFSTLVCFDWVASIESKKAWRWLVDGLAKQALEAGSEEISLSWLFVIQHNSKPSHSTFLNEVSAFFDQTVVPTVRRERACVVFVNSAGKERPGRTSHHGCTSLIFAGQSLFSDPKCHPSFSNGGAKFRSNTLLSSHRDVFFREGGACIHSFCQINPNSVNAGPSARRIALERVFVYPLSPIVDPRAPSGAVPASIKWLNDELDSISSLGVRHAHVDLADKVNGTHLSSTEALREISGQAAERAVNLATADERNRRPAEPRHADEWDRSECEAVEHLVHTLSIMGLRSAPPVLNTETAHATMLVAGEAMDLITVRGSSHEACLAHSTRFPRLQRRQTILISRDQDNTAFHPKFGRFLDTPVEQSGRERRITDPHGGLLHLSYQKLISIFIASSTSEVLEGGIDAELAA